jgi:hypothetical protein
MLAPDTEGYTEIIAASQGITPDTKGLLVKFREGAIVDDQASAAAGRPIFKSVVMITIINPGDKNNVVDRPLWPIDEQRFAVQYQRWLKTKENVVDGTPLKAWPVITENQRLELEYFHIFTVEALAGLTDQAALSNMGFLTLKQKAKDFLEAAKDGSHLTKMRAELSERDSKLAAQDQAIKDMQKKIEELSRNQRR